MKKAVLILLALLLVSSLVTAQGIKIGGWGRGFLEIAGSTIANQKPMIGPSIGWWTDGGPRIGINIIGSSENVGMQIDMNVDGSTVNVGDQAKIWVKPFGSMLTIQLGYKTYDDALRGNASFGVYNWIRFFGTPGDGFIFQRVGKAAGSGGDSAGANFELALDPAEGFHAFAALTPGYGLSKNYEQVLVDGPMYGAGYTIPGIGMIRAQYLATTAATHQINAAFKLTAVSGLTVDLGTYISMTSMNLGNMEFNLFANYAVMPTLTLNAIGSVTIVKGPPDSISYYGGIEGEYALPGDMVFTGDLRLKGSTAAGAWTGWGGLLAIQKNFSNGLCGIGFEVTNMGFAGNAPVPTPWTTDGTVIAWAVPIRLEYWF